MIGVDGIDMSGTERLRELLDELRKLAMKEDE